MISCISVTYRLPVDTNFETDLNFAFHTMASDTAAGCGFRDVQWFEISEIEPANVLERVQTVIPADRLAHVSVLEDNGRYSVNFNADWYS